MSKFKVKVGVNWVCWRAVDWVGLSGDELEAGKWDEFEMLKIKKIVENKHPGEIVEFIPIPDEKQHESKPKELDLCEILKDAPKGLKLYSTIYKEVKFERVDLNGVYPIIFNGPNGVTSQGRHLIKYNGECTLFPSFTNRDWSTFKLPYKLPVKGELCWTMSSVGNWVLRFATGESHPDGRQFFFCDQSMQGVSNTYNWQPLSEIPEVLKNHLKLK